MESERASADPLMARLLAGDRDLERLAARGVLPFPPEEIIPLQVRLAGSDDPETAREAAKSLGEAEPKRLARYVGAEAGPDELAWFAAHSQHPTVIEQVLRRRDVPRHLLGELAPRLTGPLQEIFLLRQDAIVEAPELLERLGTNPLLTPYARRRIREYRQHLLGGGEAESAAPASPDVPPPEEEGDEAAIDLPEEFEALGSETGPRGAADLSETEIRGLPLGERLQLTLGADRRLRTILLRDPHPRVALAVMRRSRLSDQEVENLVKSRSIAEEVLEEVAGRREWVRRYPILKGLVGNPKTPVGVSVKLVPRLAINDLRALSRDRNVPDAVRSTAARLYRIKRH